MFVVIMLLLYVCLSVHTNISKGKTHQTGIEKGRPLSDYTIRRQRLLNLSRDLETLTMNGADELVCV